jgi:hypothetical protein
MTILSLGHAVVVLAAAYLVAGCVVGGTVVMVAASRLLPDRPRVSPAARLILLPSAIVLWPVLAWRLAAGRDRQ